MRSHTLDGLSRAWYRDPRGPRVRGRISGNYMQATTEIGTNAPTPETRAWFGPGFVAVVIVANLAAVGLAWQDKSWGAIWIAFMAGPILNGVLAIFGLAAIPFLRRRRPGFSLAGHLTLTLGLPLVAIAVDFLAILSMNLHGH